MRIVAKEFHCLVTSDNTFSAADKDEYLLGRLCADGVNEVTAIVLY